MSKIKNLLLRDHTLRYHVFLMINQRKATHTDVVKEYKGQQIYHSTMVINICKQWPKYDMMSCKE